MKKILLKRAMIKELERANRLRHRTAQKRGIKMVKYYDKKIAQGYSSKFVIAELAEKYNVAVSTVYLHVTGRYRASNLQAIGRR